MKLRPTPPGRKAGVLAAARPTSYDHPMRRPLALAALPAVLAAALLAPRLAAAQDDDLVFTDPPSRPRLALVAWGGGLVGLGAEGGNSGLAGGEVSWAFDALDVGVLAQGYRLGAQARTPWTPVILGRIEQRFETRRGVEAILALGLGAGRTDGWIGWYQLAFGLRLAEGPLFLSGEVGFEQLDLLRLAAGVGVRF